MTDEELLKHLGKMEERINERIEKTETKLLSAFHGWARSMEIRVRHTAAAVSDFDERFALLEDRVSELERRKQQN